MADQEQNPLPAAAGSTHQDFQDFLLENFIQLQLDNDNSDDSNSSLTASHALVTTSPPTRIRWYYEQDITLSTDVVQAYHAVRRKMTLPITMNSKFKFASWDVPVPQSGKTYLDLVLGVQINNLQISSIEAVIITFEQFIGRRVYSRCEVITPRELERLCSDITVASASDPQHIDEDPEVMKWKLKEQLLQSEGVFHMAIEVKTWEDAFPDYGAIELHFIETNTDSRQYYQHDHMFKEHQPYLFGIDMNNTGCPEIEKLVRKPNFIDSYVFSREGAHLAIDLLSKSGRFVILWQIRELPDSDPRCIHKQGKPKLNVDDKRYKKDFCPVVVAWIYFSKEDIEPSAVDLALSCDGTQVAVLDKVKTSQVPPSTDPNSGEEIKENHECNTAVYRFSPEVVGTEEFPPDAAAGSGFVRVNVADTCPNFVDFAGRAEFHVVAAKNPDPKDEYLVACDGITIEIYSVYGTWTHLRTIVLESSEDNVPSRRNVYAALFKQLRGRHLVLVNAQGNKVTTWDILTGKQVSSNTSFGALEMWALSHVSNVSRDGMLISIPGKERLGIFDTTTWDVVGWFRFPRVGRREYVGEGLFIKDDTQVMVAIESDEQPLYHKNRGYIIDLKTMKVVDEYVSSGTDIFRALPTRDCEEEQVILGVGNSTAYAFPLDSRLLYQPRQQREESGEEHEVEL